MLRQLMDRGLLGSPRDLWTFLRHLKIFYGYKFKYRFVKRHPILERYEKLYGYKYQDRCGKKPPIFE